MSPLLLLLPHHQTSAEEEELEDEDEDPEEDRKSAREEESEVPKSPEPPPGPVLAPAEGPPLQALGQPSGSFICEMPNCGAVSVSASSGDLGLGGRWAVPGFKAMHFRRGAVAARKVSQREYHIAVCFFPCLFVSLLVQPADVAVLGAQGPQKRSLPSGSMGSRALQSHRAWFCNEPWPPELTPRVSWCPSTPQGLVTLGPAL